MVNITVACAGPVGASKVLRDGSQGERAAHAAVPGLECTRQLRHTHQEEEAETVARWTRWSPASAANDSILVSTPTSSGIPLWWRHCQRRLWYVTYIVVWTVDLFCDPSTHPLTQLLTSVHPKHCEVPSIVLLSLSVSISSISLPLPSWIFAFIALMLLVGRQQGHVKKLSGELLAWLFVVWPTTSCFADWLKRRHVTAHFRLSGMST